MSKIVVAGLINIETTLKVKEFPICYFPIDYPFFGIHSTVSGVAVNIPKALSVLGEEVEIISLLGQDEEASRVDAIFEKEGWSTEYLKYTLLSTPQSIVLYDSIGRRQIYCDLKDIQEKEYEENIFSEAIKECSVAIICNSNFARPLIKVAKEKNILIATDVHVLNTIHDDYNHDFMENADILFLSDEKIPCDATDFICDLKNTYKSKIIVIGLGSKGALMYVRQEDALYQVDAVYTREVINTVGAGDALFSSFIHYYIKGQQPIEALKRAQIFASYKIGADGAANGFINAAELEAFYKNIVFQVNKIS